jgi:hypothetical protein
MNHTRLRPHLRLYAVVGASVSVLSGCASGPAPSPSADPQMSFEHIHELVAEGAADLLVGTHQGLYRLSFASDGTTTAVGPIGGLDFDPMGFTLAGGTAYASGHPGPTTPESFGSPNLGLIASTDLGETWTNVSLSGVTDFHALTASSDGASVYGIDTTKERLQISNDSGATWTEGAELVARDILAVGDELYATTPEGLAKSHDGGLTFRLEPTPPTLYLVAADEAGTMAGVDTTGTLWTRIPEGEWVHGRTIEWTPQAVAVEGHRIYVADDRGIAFTDDIGVSWVVLAIGK